MQACGHLYLDEGEELEVGQSRENLLAFQAFAMENNSGQVLCLSCPTFAQHQPSNVMGVLRLDSGHSRLADLSQMRLACR